MKLTYNDMDKPAFIYASIFVLANRLQTLGDKIDPGISTKQWLVLAMISKFKKTIPNIGDIADLMGSSRQNIKKIAVILKQRGYVELRRDEADQRNIRLILTSKCYEYFKSREQQEDRYLKQLFLDVEENMLFELCKGLTKLNKNVNRIEIGYEN